MSEGTRHGDQPPWGGIGINDAIAAALTRRVGSMPAVYLALVVVGGWMAAATWGPLRRIDPYPFAFMLFLNNVVQLMLCLAILVGQRVLGAAADRRALQTYLSAEAIFAEVTELQQHLDRHDRALSRGIGLLHSRPHPWIEQHRVQPPPRAGDQAVTTNERIAVWLTRRLGSMWAFYAAGATQVTWIGLAAVGVQRVDPYPFKFMTFLSTLAQLIAMLVIIVGQDVLGRAGDRRAQQTYLDAEAILHECRRMRARLGAQDRIITGLCEFTSAQLTERLARAIHRAYLRAALEGGEALGSRAALRTWEELDEDLRQANRAQAWDVGEKLAALSCVMVPAVDAGGDVTGEDAFTFEEAEVELLARLEHERWMLERLARGYRYGPADRWRSHPDLRTWDELSDESRAKDERTVRQIPALLAAEGFRVLRVGQTAAV